MKNFYYEKLEDTARETAFLYFEKDVLAKTDAKRYKEIENQLATINSKAIRVYNAKTLQIYLNDDLDFKIDNQILKSIIRKNKMAFHIDSRQFLGLLYKDNIGNFIVVVSGIDFYGERQIKTLGWMFIFFYLVAIPLNYLIGRSLSRKTFRPFEEVISKVNSITTENLYSRLQLPQKTGDDEIKELIVTFNNLLERLESGIAIQNNFLKNASHELKTPLTIIIGDIEVALQLERTNAEYRELLNSLRKDSLHLKSILDGLLVLSGLQIFELEQFQELRVDEIIWNVLEKKAIEYPESKVLFNLDSIANHSDLLTINANRYLLFIALNNIIDNAIKFSSPKIVSIFAQVESGQLLLQIIDHGQGISEDEIEAIFELFFRSKRTQNIKGMGLGLYITNQILIRHGIKIVVKSEIDEGTTVALYFPN